MNKENIIEVNELNKVMGNYKVLKDVNFLLRKKASLLFLGQMMPESQQL